MADGTPDFADLLAAFDEPPAVTLQQISSGYGPNLSLSGGGLPLNHQQPYIPNQNRAQFPQINTAPGAVPNQLGQINQDAGLQNPAYIPSNAAQAPASNEESFGGGSLGSMFLSSVESMLSDQGTNLALHVSQPVVPERTMQRKPKQSRQKPNTVQLNRNNNLQQNRNLPLANAQQFVNIAPAATQIQGSAVPSPNASLSSNPLGMKVTNNSVASPPFILPSELQAAANIPFAGQQKMQQGPFVHPTLASRQQQTPSANPPRPLSAASSTSEHLSRPGSVQQPSPSCGSSHSGDPATPLTPQSYNAGTPQSYKPATPQSYKPATPQSGLVQPQQRQRTTYGDIHQQQAISTGADNFLANQRTSLMFQPSPSPIQGLNTSNDSLSDLPTPVKDAFNIVSTASGSFHTQTGAVAIGNQQQQQQLWSSGPAVMAPSALFTSSAQPKDPTSPNFLASEPQINFGYVGMPGVPIQIPNRPESNVRSESLTSKQNELLEQLSSGSGKSKAKPIGGGEQPHRNASFDSGMSGLVSSSGKSDSAIPKQTGSIDTMNMMNKANNAGASAVKELLGAHAQYEAISPVSDYGMSPARKTSIQDDLSSSIMFSLPSFSSNSEMPLTQDVATPQSDPMTDPVLLYLKRDTDQSTVAKTTTTSNVATNNTRSGTGSYFPQDLTTRNSGLASTWSEQSSPSLVGDQQPVSQSSYNAQPSVLAPALPISTTPSCQSSNSAYIMTTWNSQLPIGTSTRSNMVTQTVNSVQTNVVESNPTKPWDDLSKPPTSQVSSYKQKIHPTNRQPNTKSVDSSKPFGVQRKSSVDKSKSSFLKQKKGQSFDEKFGFDSDDDTETICLSKVSPKSNRKQNLLSPKPAAASALADEEFKNKLEGLKQLQQQQAKLRKIQEYQAQHRGGHLQPTTVPINMHRTIIAQPQAAKPVTQMDILSKVSQESFPLYSTQARPTFASFSLSKEVSKSSQNAVTKRPSLEFHTPLSLAQPSVSPKFVDAPKIHVGEHTIHTLPTLPSLPTTTVVSQAPNFFSYLNLPSQEPSKSIAEKTLSSNLPSSNSHQSHGIASLLLPVAATSASSKTQSHFPRPSHTSASQIPSYNTSFIDSDVATKCTQSIIPVSVPAPSFTKESKSLPVSSALQLDGANSNKLQPFDYAHFNLDWLHKEVVGSENRKATASVQGQPASILSKNSVNANVTFSTTSQIANETETTAQNMSVPKPVFSLTEDMAPKQSIHTVHHIQPPKTQPPSTSHPTTTPPKETIPKENVPVTHEPKHFNLKKHRILEGVYPQPSDCYKTSRTTYTAAPLSNASATTGHSVLDKQRKYSKERSSVKPKHRIQHQVMDMAKSQTPVSSVPSNALQSPVKTSDKSVDETGVKPPDSKTSKEERKDNPKDDQAGSMLMLFNSLLQEASQSAKDSLKTTLITKEDEKSDKSKEPKVHKPATTISQVSDNLKPKVVSGDAVKGTKTVVTTVTSSTVVQGSLSQNMTLAKKATKKNRPAATVPFKRRPYPAYDDSLIAAAVTTTAVMTVSVASKPPINTPLPTSSSTSLTTSCVSTQSNFAASKPVSVMTKLLTAPYPTATSKEAAESLTGQKLPLKGDGCKSPLKTVVPKSPSKAVALPKLRITAFRSSKGMVIHQSSVLGGDTESVDSDTSSHHRRKKKKKKKRKRKISSSDNDSSVSSAMVKSVADQTALLAREAEVNEQITRELERKAEAILKSVESATAKSPSVEDKPQRGRKRTKAAASDNMPEKKKPAKRVKTVKLGGRKKQDDKNEEPLVRYQPKSALQAVSSTNGAPTTTTKTMVSLPSTFHRAPGKLPLYLSSSEAKSATTVPTIQLVARNTKLIGAAENKSSQPTKVVSVKISSSLQSKSFPTHLLSSGVQYIIPTTRAQPRVILPSSSISTPVTVPVSIVSPLLARSFSGGFVPVSILTTSTSPSSNTTKPQLFTVPLTVSNSVTTSIKIVRGKDGDVAKTISKASLVSKTLPVDVSLALSKTSTKSSSVLAKLTTSSVTVSGTLATPRVAPKVLSPTASPLRHNAFQSTFLKLISSQNPVPTYLPPPPPRHLEVDISGTAQHQCLECKDTFMFDQSLEDHYQRRCILIKVRCMQCDKDLVFFNKCKLLLHARQHSDKGGNGMQFNNAHISPLPISMCKPRPKESFLKTGNASSGTKTRRISIMNSEDETSAAGTSPTYPTMLSCTDCNFCGATPEALEEHFQRVSPPASPDKASGLKAATNFSCDMCSVTVPNQCSFNAHMRMHKRATPHTCPECGQTFDNDGLLEHAYSESRREIDFNLHLSIHCFHLSRMSAYKCKLCTSIFKNADLLRRHLEVRHLQTFYKCRDCPMAFKTQENISSHQRSAHGVVVVTKTIHKCPLCETVFTDNSTTQQLFLLQKHFEGHMTHPSINITAYKCLFCNHIYERKSLLRDHLKSAHDVTATGDGSSSPGLSKEWNEARLLVGLDKSDSDAVNTSKKRPTVKSSGKEPAVKISKLMTAGENAASNLLIASGIIEGSKKSSYSNSSTLDSPAMMKSAKQPLKLRLKGMSRPTGSGVTSVLQAMDDEMNQSCTVGAILRDGKKVYPCGECSKELPSASARLNHIRLKHKGIRTLYCCPHCPPGKTKFAKKISLKKHLKKTHAIEEVRKQDVITEYVKLPIGQRFDPAIVKQDMQVSLSSSHKGSSSSGDHKVRKKITVLGRRPSRPIRQARRELENGSPYIENSDSEVEQIMSNYSKIEDIEKSDDEEPDFSSLRLPDSYSCAKCDFQSEDRLEFQVHITEHREDAENEGMPSALEQCTECGLCFASQASHAKHLFIKHKIKKKKLLEKYDRKLRTEREASGSLPASFEGNSSSRSQNGPGTISRHKCMVCYKRFDNDTQLRTHMRNHGLAFVKSKHTS